MNEIERLGTFWNDQLPGLLQGFPGVMVGVSGGADSTAVFRLLCELAKPEKKFRLCLFHINFGLRGKESDEDERFCRELAKRFEVPAVVINRLEQACFMPPAQGVQDWARNLRLREWTKWQRRGWLIATGHHLGDVAETTLMRLGRGTGAGRMAGLAEFERGYWRPLLRASKAEIFAYLTGLDQPHREDSSNATMKYSRNIVRHKVLHLLEELHPGATGRLAESALDAQEQFGWLRQSLLSEMEANSASVPWLLSLPRSVAAEALLAWCELQAGPSLGWTRERLHQALSQMAVLSKDEAAWTLAGGIRLIANSQSLRIEPPDYFRPATTSPENGDFLGENAEVFRP